MSNIKKLLACLSVLLACSVIMSQPVYASVAGHVQFVNGDVQITNSEGHTRQVQKGDAVNEGDTLTSAPSASAQIKMQDGGFVAIRTDTKLKFDLFVFAGKQDGNEKSFFSLLKGGFRAVTGLIGQVNKQNYRITTPAATIGIRGTDHETFLVVPGSPFAKIAPTGVYNKVNAGETVLTTNRGTISVMPNQMGFAGGLDQPPRLQPINTNIFTVAAAPTPKAMVEKKEGKKVENNEQAGSKQDEKPAKNGNEGDKDSKKSVEQGAATASAEPSKETVGAVRSNSVTDTITPSATLVQNPVASVTESPAVNAAQIIVPKAASTQVVLTAVVTTDGTAIDITTGTATTNTGQQVVLNAPTLATCTVAPATAGCTAVLPGLATCTASPTTAGCTAVLPDLATCTASPTTAGCTAVLPGLATCTASPATAGCTAVLPDKATCMASPITAGCSAVLVGPPAGAPVGTIGGTCTNSSAPPNSYCSGNIWVKFTPGSPGGTCTGTSAPSGSYGCDANSNTWVAFGTLGTPGFAALPATGYMYDAFGVQVVIPSGGYRSVGYIYATAANSSAMEISLDNQTVSPGGWSNYFSTPSSNGTATNSANTTTFTMGTATQKDFGYDPVTGISWGRWQGSWVTNDATQGSITASASSNLHWFASPAQAQAISLPVTGTFNYAVMGWTAPTDNYGTVGTLTSATFNANFTAQTVNVSIGVKMPTSLGGGVPVDMNATANNVPILAGANFKTTTPTVTCTGCITAATGVIGGQFGQGGLGAGVGYGLTNGSQTINGVTVFTKGVSR